MRTALLASLAAASVSCGTAALPPCDLPAGCLQVERVDGACQCREWQVVSIWPVPVKYVVVGVIYSPIGNRSMVAYGYWDGSTEGGVVTFPPTASDLGGRWRSLVRAPDGVERVAALGPLDVPGNFTWGPMVPVTGTSAALVQPSNGAMGISTPTFDLLERHADGFLVWINPEAAVAADYAGGSSVAWSAPASDVHSFVAGWLDGSIAPPPNPYVQARLDALDANDRAAILSYDPFYDPAWDPSAIASDPRFQLVANVAIDSHTADPVVQPLTWIPCAGTLADDDFPVLAQSAEVPYGRGETLLLQHSVISASASCTPQHPGLMVGTSTPDCSIEADVYVDKAFGTLLMMPTSVSAACTRP